MELTNDEQLVIFNALIKVLKEKYELIVNEEKANMCELYNATGANRRQLKIGDIVCGTMSYEQRKPKIEPREPAGMQYLRDNGLTEERPVRYWQNFFEVYPEKGLIVNKETGEDVSVLFDVYDGQIVCPVRGVKPDEVADAIDKVLDAPEIRNLLDCGA